MNVMKVATLAKSNLNDEKNAIPFWTRKIEV